MLVCALHLPVALALPPPPQFESDGLLNPRFGGAGAFELRVERIATYNAPAPSADDGAAPLSWVHISSAGVTRPHRPGIDVAVEPPAVRMNAMLGNLLDHKLAAEDALRSSAPGLRAAIVRPTALTEEPLGAPLVVAQGDTIRGKVARDEVAALAVDLLTAVPTPLPAGGTFTFEIASTVPFSTPWTGPEDGGAAPQRDWADLLAPLKAGVTGRTMGGVYTGDKPEAEALAAAAAAAGAGAQPPAGVGARA